MTNEEKQRVLVEQMPNIVEKAQEIVHSMKAAGLDSVMKYEDALPMALSSASQEILPFPVLTECVGSDAEEIAVSFTFPS